MTRLPSLLALLLLCCVVDVQARQPSHTAIASAHPLATQAGEQMLAAGGNAFDAAIAVSAALAVVEPYGSGLGGGGFFLLRHAGAQPDYRFIDAREKAPLKTRAGLFLRNGKVERNLSLNGPLAAAIPGLPAAWVELARQHGRLSLEQNLAPAIRLARQGFAVDRVYRQRAAFRLSALRDDAESARLFLVDGEVPAEGHLLRQPELAATLETLAAEGHAGFYSGALAAQLVEGVSKAGGIWSMEDLASYHVVERKPLRVRLEQDRELISAPPPSAGGVALGQSLLMLQELPWRAANKVERSHLVVEVLRRVYRDRALLGDPEHVANPTEQLLDPAYLHAQAAQIDPLRATPSASLAPAPSWREGDHTTHFAVLDAQGNAVAATLSINLPFGAAFTVPGTGVLLNDEMDDFAVDPAGTNTYGLDGSPANALAAGKRPLSSMSPSFIESRDDFASFGTPGGSRIPSMVLLAMLEYLQDRPIADWVGVARFHHQFHPDRIEYEPGAFSAEEVQALQRRGHRLDALTRDYGNQQVVHWNKRSGAVEAASDPRGIGSSLLGPVRP